MSIDAQCVYRCPVCLEMPSVSIDAVLLMMLISAVSSSINQPPPWVTVVWPCLIVPRSRLINPSLSLPWHIPFPSPCIRHNTLHPRFFPFFPCLHSARLPPSLPTNPGPSLSIYLCMSWTYWTVQLQLSVSPAHLS